jgi:23S rRNA (adenine2030-N6)-methyltransferase
VAFAANWQTVNYRHLFHAGHFADVFKHVILVRLIKALQNKDKGFAYIETHAGPGRYDLQAPEAQKTGEYRDGIARLWDAVGAAEMGIAEYLAAVRAVNRDQRLRYYPGSPRIARLFLRPQDRMRLCEQGPVECEQLQAEFAGDRQVNVHCGDGHALLKGWLPPPERRGLVLIDPPYERPDEFSRVCAGLRMATDRWPNGMYAVWYPIKDRATCLKWRRDVIALGLRKTLCAEIAVFPEDNAFRLNGCGMILVNPPWRLDEAIAKSLPLMLDRLKRETPGRCEVTWLVPE